MILPDPNYDYDVRKLVTYYEKAVADILQELEALNLTNFQRANALAVLRSIGDILAELDEKASAWAEVNIEKAAADGVVRAIVALGVVETEAEARLIVKFNRVNKELVKAAVADTQADLMAVSQNIDRKTRAAIRQVTAEVLRNNLPKGINATQSLKRDIVAELRKTLGDSVNTGIIDAAGRRWKPHTYADMLVRTKMMQAHKEATINEAVGRGVYYGIISRHNAKDACRNYEGKTVKLIESAPGDFPSIGTLPRREIFHPYCRHTVSPVRRLD
jgi:hypothetical protein